MPNRLPDPPYKIEDRGYSTPCWIWLGCQRKGYGLVSNPNYNGSGAKMMSAHVFIYEKVIGIVSNRGRLFVPDHLCRVKLCVNPDHIYQGTRGNNTRDSVIRGRYRNQNTNTKFCKYEHEFTEKNTYTYPDGRRSCRICRERHALCNN